MKRFIIIVLLGVLFFGCDSENAPDCFQRTGEIVRKEVVVPDFTRILVNPNVELIVKEEEVTKVIIESGENLIDEVFAIVEGDRLIVGNTNDCNLVRSFNQTRIFISAPNITQIRSATQFDISSDGTLRYPSLRLISEDFLENNGGNTTGTFTMEIDNSRLSVVGNNIASFFIKGNTEFLEIELASGTGRFEGADLTAENIKIRHRGSNKMIINPQQSLKGSLLSTGDVISVNRPAMVEVEAFFTGRLIFQ